MPKRVVAFVDGFNLYHSISKPRFRKYCWLDLKKLVTHFLRSNESLDALHYYTAFATWRSQDSMSRHRAYISALESTGVNHFGHGPFLLSQNVGSKLILPETANHVLSFSSRTTSTPTRSFGELELLENPLAEVQG